MCSVQLLSLHVVGEPALVRPPLGHGLQLLVPHHLLHVAGCGLAPVEAVGLLAFRHPPPELVLLVQDGSLGSVTQLPEHSLGGALSRGALRKCVGKGYVAFYIMSYGIFAHSVRLILVAKVCITWNSRSCGRGCSRNCSDGCRSCGCRAPTWKSQDEPVILCLDQLHLQSCRQCPRSIPASCHCCRTF